MTVDAGARVGARQSPTDVLDGPAIRSARAIRQLLQVQRLHAQADKIEELRARASTGPVTILHAARDRQHNNAVVLAELLRDR